MARGPADKPDFNELHEAITALATIFSTFQTAQDQRHESYLSSIKNLQTWVLAQDQTILSSSSTSLSQPMKPPNVPRQPFDGINPL